MNKVLHINLGGYPFIIDEDAHVFLERYLKAIDRKFRPSDGYDEIVRDIETRLAELLKKRLGDRSIVDQQDIDAIIDTMGRPETFGAEPIEETYSSENGSDSDSKYQIFKPGKKLFRSPDGVLGGVCAGFAAYLGIENANLVRAIFLIAFFAGYGLALPVYLILWAVLPEAVTAGDRLAMLGEPVNINNIGKIIEEELRNLSDSVESFSDDWTSEKKNYG